MPAGMRKSRTREHHVTCAMFAQPSGEIVATYNDEVRALLLFGLRHELRQTEWNTIRLKVLINSQDCEHFDSWLLICYPSPESPSSDIICCIKVALGNTEDNRFWLSQNSSLPHSERLRLACNNLSLYFRTSICLRQSSRGLPLHLQPTAHAEADRSAAVVARAASAPVSHIMPRRWSVGIQSHRHPPSRSWLLHLLLSWSQSVAVVL